jgi:HEAT repeat protein
MHGNSDKGMPIQLQSQRYFMLAQALGLGAGFLLAGCTDPKASPQATGVDSRPTPALSESRELPSSSASLDSRPVPALVNTAAPQNPSDLMKEFRTATEPDRRGEVVEALWSLDTPAAVETIRQLFLTEREADVKMDMIVGLSDSKKPETREARFGLVVAALAPGQPKDIRELAAQMLIDFEDPRAVGLLQQFTQDADPDMREAASEALETRKAVEQQ